MSMLSVSTFLIWIVILGGSLWGFRPHWQMTVEAEQNRPTKTIAKRKTALVDADGYVGSSECAHCHLDIYTDFSRTRMGRSLTPVTPALIKTLSLPDTIYIQSLNRHFEVSSQNGKLYQTEYQTEGDEQEIFRNTHEVEWIMGAGANGFGGTVRRGDYLFEGPMSFYTKLGKWDLSPGYEQNDIGFNRPIQGTCISCHSGRPRPLDQITGKFDAVAFTQTAIGCENCHGPGAAHIRAMRTPHSPHGGSQIVNPGRLSANLENDICMSCHEGGDSRVLKPGKTYQDFRPGTPLDDTLSILMIPRKRGDPDNSDPVQHYYEMATSMCFRKTSGQLRCATCHDPHIEPSKEEAPAYFNEKCMGCHTDRSCTLPVESRRQTAPVDNCIGCHMPQRDVQHLSHTSLTNHRILARQTEPWPETTSQETMQSLPGLLHLNRVPGRNEDLSLLGQLEALRQISERKPEYRESYLTLLDKAGRTNPDDASAQMQLGRRDMEVGQPQNAIEHFDRSLELDPQQPMTLGYLSNALAQRGQIAEAIAASEKAVEQDPYSPLLQKELIERLIAGKEYPKAQAAMERYVKDFPEDDFMRKMLSIAKQ
jgi:Flp pilus assembly protein TadD